MARASLYLLPALAQVHAGGIRADLPISDSAGDLLLAQPPPCPLAIGGTPLQVTTPGPPMAASLPIVEVTNIHYVAVHGNIDITCDTSRYAIVRFRIQDLILLVWYYSDWSTPGLTHAVNVLAGGGRTYLVQVRANAQIDPDLPWTTCGYVTVPPRGDPPVEGDWHIE